LDLIATVIEHCQGPSEPGPGHPPAATVRVLASLRRFLREGTPWRGLRATPAQASGSTLRRRLAEWAEINLLQRVHAMLVAMLRGNPDLILDSSSVRAKRGGDLVGPNPTDRPRQARQQISCRRHRRWRAGRLCGHRCQRQRHASVRAPVRDGLCRRGQDRDRVR
jgi:hypothetical protein